MNYKKSAILQIKADNRTPEPTVTQIRGIPVVTSYKYLGVQINNCLRFELQSDKLKQTLQNYEKVARFKKIRRLPAFINYHNWQTLVKSKVNYGTFLLSPISKPIQNQYKSFLYRSYKLLMGIKSNPEREKLIEAVSGVKSEEIFKQEEFNVRQLIKKSKTERIKPKNNYSDNVKRVILSEAKHLVKFLTNCLYRRTKKPEHQRICHCSERMTQKHLIEC